MKCDSGTFKAGTDLEKQCEDCATGKYKATPGEAQCDDCQANSGTGTSTGSTAVSACVADAGHTGSGNSVTKCAADTFKAASGAETCTPCPANSETAGAMGSTASTDCVAVPTEASASGSVSASGSGSNDSGSNAWWIILVVLMVLGFGAAAAFFLNQKKKDRVVPVQDREALKKAFDNFDTDNSGELSKEEFRTVMMMSGSKTGLTDVQFETLFQEVDKDASGVISFDEYYAWSQV